MSAFSPIFGVLLLIRWTTSPVGAKAFVGIYLFNEVVVAITEPAAYLMAAELFPLHVRTKGVSISFGFLVHLDTLIDWHCVVLTSLRPPYLAVVHSQALTNTWILESAGTMVHSLGWKGEPFTLYWADT